MPFPGLVARTLLQRPTRSLLTVAGIAFALFVVSRRVVILQFDEALVAKARTLAMLVTVLPSAGIVSAIAIPALLGQREKAKIRAVALNLSSQPGSAQLDIVVKAVRVERERPYRGFAVAFCAGAVVELAGQVQIIQKKLPGRGAPRI